MKMIQITELQKNLAVEIVSEEAFEEISDENLRQAEEMAASCKKVYCTLKKFGKINQKTKFFQKKCLHWELKYVMIYTRESKEMVLCYA